MLHVLWQAGIVEEDAQDPRIEVSVLADLHRRDSDPFLPDLSIPATGTHVHGADLEVVHHEAGETDELAVEEGGRE